MRSGGTSVTVSGLKEFESALARADAESGEIIFGFFEGVSSDLLREGRSLMRSQLVGDDLSGKLEGSWKADAGSPTKPWIRVSFGGDDIPYAGWWEFGGTTNSSRGDTTRQFIKAGRSLYVTAAKNAEAIRAGQLKVLDALVAIIAGGSDV